MYYQYYITIFCCQVTNNFIICCVNEYHIEIVTGGGYWSQCIEHVTYK